MSLNILEIIKLNKETKHQKLTDISLELKYGEVMALTGPIGSGKTTLLKSILNLSEIDNGKIIIFGLDHNKDEHLIKGDIAFISDSSIFADTWTAHNINFIMSNIHASWSKETFENLLLDFELPGNIQLKRFTPNMKFKIMLAAALSRNSKLMIIDGAVTRQDAILKAQMPMLLKNYISDREHSILYSCGEITKDLAEITDEVSIINKGKIISKVTINEYLDMKKKESENGEN